MNRTRHGYAPGPEAGSRSSLTLPYTSWNRDALAPSRVIIVGEYALLVLFERIGKLDQHRNRGGTRMPAGPGGLGVSVCSMVSPFIVITSFWEVTLTSRP
jgi:hypothetical protein